MARKKVPKKNIFLDLTDIRRPGGAQPIDAESGALSPSETEAVLRTVIRGAEEAGRAEPRHPRSRGRRTGVFLIALAGAAIAAGALFAADFFYVRREFLQALRIDLPVLQSAVGSERVSAGEKSFRLTTLDFRGAYGDLKVVTSHVYGLLTAAGELHSRWPELLVEHRGEELTAKADEIRRRVTELEAAERKLLSHVSPLRNFLPFSESDYLAMNLHLTRFKNFLDALVPWISSPEDRRFLVLLENSSELRPGGGFLGSYLEITVRGGDARQIAVRDINEPDRELKVNIVPPRPLQPTVTRLRAADANWFFDFPTSARKIVELLEASEFYKRDGITFDGVVAVTPAVVKDVLEVTGPVALPHSQTLDKDNFLTELQRQVTQGERRGDPSPKKILAEFFPVLMEKVKGLTASDRERIARRVGEWFARKDAALHFKDPEFERFFRAYELTGAVYDLPDDFYGDYFAVVRANVGGGKTDAVMQEKIELQSQIGADGIVRNHVEIVRAHGGAKSEFPWYRFPHEDYLRLFTPPQARLDNVTGGVVKKIVPRVDYKAAGYVKDPDVEALEATARTDLRYPGVTMLRENGKNVFAAWVKTLPGKTSRIAFDYQFRLPAPPAGGSGYRFVFEKQSGAAAAYVFTINAPLGFRFRENGLPLYEYQSDDPPGRLILNLTLEYIL